MADTQSQPQIPLQGAGAGAAATTASVPSGEPPQSAIGAAGDGTAAAGTVWNNNKTVSSLWSINQDRNSWMGVANVGWVKLSTASDSGVVALTALAAHAYQTKHIVNYRTESDGMVHEIYAW
jgi:hypothetical protein